MSAKWANVKIPSTLAKQADDILETGGYASRSAFAQDAIRRRIEEIRKSADTSDNQLTDTEKQHLYAWAKDRPDLRHKEEAELGEVLLTENQHIWPWLWEKLVKSVEYIFSLKHN